MSNANDKPNSSNEPIIEPFPKPTTFPSGWDLSGFDTDAKPSNSDNK